MSPHQNRLPVQTGTEAVFLAEEAVRQSGSDFEYDKPQDECGVVAVYAPGEPVCQIVYQGMRAVQHRGQTGAGIAFATQMGMLVHKGPGQVPDAIGAAVMPQPNGSSQSDVYSSSHIAIGHTRYSTSESNKLDALHPFLGEQTGFALAHNGHVELLDGLAERYGVDINSAPSDSGLLSAIIDAAAATYEGNITRALHEVLPQVEGAYNLVIATAAGLHVARDPWGFHPLVLGKLQNDAGYVVASEAVAFKTMGAEFIRDVAAGEILFINEQGVQSQQMERQELAANCLFEYVYTSRVDGIINGVSVYNARKYFGRFLATDTPVEADVVVGVPGSGLTAASGYSEASGLPRVDGILRDPYTARTFIERGSSRQNSLFEKFHLIPEELAGKRVVLVDDSIIKSNTMKQLVSMVRDAGAAEVHVRSSAPPYRNSCFMGMDTADTSKLVARHMSNAEICELIGADSIGFNTPERMAEAITLAQIDQTAAAMGQQLCMACVTGKYPIKVPEGTETITRLPMPQVRTVQNLGNEALVAASASSA